jgi:hypothetical protein
VSTGWAELLAGLLIGLTLLGLGFYVGLGIREDREADRHAKVALARLEAVRTARPLAYAIPAPDHATAPAYYLPGYADPFPRPGRFAIEHAGQLAGAEAPQPPHGPASRPITSPVDLDGAVRLMCIEAEQYVANLIAGTYHAEGNEN